ncbi:MAG: SDR family NAD(P)-dependent oxidoreductase, partial [Salinisphaera sp.]|nr:SDR family NAD(P)-dependent oxidoreductase [Salinisphaera sp.]
MTTENVDYNKLFRLDGKVALVTGGARGIGAEVCRALAAAGAKVMVTDLLEDEGQATVEALKQDGAQAAFRKQDVCDEDQWEATVAATLDQLGGLDVLVNNAGVEAMKFVTDTELADFRQVMDVNINGVFLGCKHAVRAMRPQGQAGQGGSIINLSSIAGLVGFPALHAYTASKGAVRVMTKSVAVECGRLNQGVRCNSIHPGLIKTELSDIFLSQFVDVGLMESTQAAEEAFVSAIPLGHNGA